MNGARKKAVTIANPTGAAEHLIDIPPAANWKCWRQLHHHFQTATGPSDPHLVNRMRFASDVGSNQRLAPTPNRL